MGSPIKLRGPMDLGGSFPGRAETVLDEAGRLVEGPKAEAYGDALEGARKWARTAGAVTGREFRPEEFPLIMIAVKLSRVGPDWHRDTWVDIAGYVRVAELIHQGLAQEATE